MDFCVHISLFLMVDNAITLFNYFFRDFRGLRDFRNFRGFDLADFRNLIMKNPLKNKAFEESSKSKGVFRTHASIYDGAFL